MRLENCYKYSKRDVKRAVYKIYKNFQTYDIQRENAPVAYLLGGQSGAGKSTIHQILLSQNPNTIVIDGDLYREFHPNFSIIQRLYGENAANYTQSFSNSVVNLLIKKLSNKHFNLIIEGTCRTVEVILSISLYTIFSKNTSFFESVAIFTERSGVNIATDSVELP